MRYLLFLLSITMLQSCKGESFTIDEKKLIVEGDTLTPFRILLVRDATDSLFLRKKCEDIATNHLATDKLFQQFISRLKITMGNKSGVGIAAPQVGIARNVFLFRRVTEPEKPIQVVVNPKIIAHSEELVCFEQDGCLSIPGVWGNSSRYAWIDVEYLNEKGERVQEKLSGHSRESDFTGIIFQHEFDHLEGVLFTDKLCTPKVIGTEAIDNSNL